MSKTAPVTHSRDSDHGRVSADGINNQELKQLSISELKLAAAIQAWPEGEPPAHLHRLIDRVVENLTEKKA